MALPLTVSFTHLEDGPSSSKATLGDTPPVPSPLRGLRDDYGGKEEDDWRPMASFLPTVDAVHGNLHDLMSARVWRNRVIWRAGVSAVAIPRMGARANST